MTYRFDTVEVDVPNQDVRIAGTSRKVEPQVMAVLTYLIEQRHRVVPKEELLDEVWGSRFVSAAAVTSRIKSVRQAIGDSGKAQAMIRTVHGRGYRFVAAIDEAPDSATGPPATGRTPVRDTTMSGRTAPVPEPTAPARTASARAVDGGWPLVGRDAELERVLQAAQQGDLGGLLLTGEAGLGKTRLARATIEAAEQAGRTVARINGQIGTAKVPLAAIAHLLPDDVSSDEGVDGDLARSRLLQRARAAINSFAEESRLVLMVDDVDRVDGLSLAILGSLIADHTVFAVMTQRTAADDRLTLGHLVRSGQVGHVPLEPLPDDQMIALLGRVLDGPVQPQTSDAFVAAADGFPGVLRQLVEASMAGGSVTRRGGVWRLTGRLTAPGNMAAAVEARLETLTTDQRDALELVTIAGDIDIDIAFDLIDEAVLDHLELEGLISVRAVGPTMRVRVAHPLFGEILTDALNPLRERRHRSTLASALSQHAHRSPADRLQLVRLQIDSDAPIPTEHLVESAALAFIESDTGLTLRLLKRVPEHERNVRYHQLLGEALYFRGRFDDAAAVWKSIEPESLDPDSAVGVIRRLTTWMFYGSWQFTEAIEYLDEQLGRFEGDHRRMLESYWTMIAAVDGTRASEVIERGERLLTAATGVTLVDTLSGVAMAHFVQGRYDTALELLARCNRAADGLERTVLWNGLDYANFVEILAHIERGDLDAGWRTFERITPPGAPPPFGFESVSAGRLALAAGRWQQVLDWLDPHIQIAEALGITTNGRPLQATAAVAAMMLGDHERAMRDAATMRSDLPDVVNLTTLDISWAILSIDAATGDRSAGASELLAAAGRAADAGLCYIESMLLTAAVHHGAADRAVGRLGELVDLIDGPLIGLRHRAARAVLGEDDLDDVRARLDELGLAYEATALRRLVERGPTG